MIQTFRNLAEAYLAQPLDSANHSHNAALFYVCSCHLGLLPNLIGFMARIDIELCRDFSYSIVANDIPLKTGQSIEEFLTNVTMISGNMPSQLVPK